MTLESLQSQFEKYKTKKLVLDMSRGKPSEEQLNLSNSMLDLLSSTNYNIATNTDIRNYGGLDGLPETKELFKGLLEVSSIEEVVIGGNSSLTLMHDVISRAMTHGVCDSEKPWGKSPIKFICPSPGYDRHFSICEHFGIEMITTSYNDDGPDMDEIEDLVASDESIKGVWIVPKYGNPSGITCSNKVVDRLSNMITRAKDFRIFWDNAYAVHHLSEDNDKLKNILKTCKQANNPNRPFIFASTSKITFSGGGIAALGGSIENMDWKRRHLFFSTIGPDKLNQVRHTRFFKDVNAIQLHMMKHAEILKPRFDKTIEVLEQELGDSGLANWKLPKGGYFISLNVPNGTAKRVVHLTKELGVNLTAAGATFPYKKDPFDSNIRLAPSFPTVIEIEEAMKIVCLAIKIAAFEMNQKKQL